ncbi:MAG: retroviral-like aspartic protease family protein [Amphritea sp.]|nr:retroviral-like aspartic protease family protein [Amphritea sp.]
MSADQSRRFVGRLFTHMTWIVILGLFYLLFEDQLLQRENPNHNLTVVNTGEPVVLQRNRQGHYVAPGEINGVPVTFLLDTGATDISIPGALSKKLRLKAGQPFYARTANGTIEVYSTVLDRVSLGGIEQRNVRASINPHMDSRTILLGMSFMQHLEMIQRGDTLTLKP